MNIWTFGRNMDNLEREQHGSKNSNSDLSSEIQVSSGNTLLIIKTDGSLWTFWRNTGPTVEPRYKEILNSDFAFGCFSGICWLFSYDKNRWKCVDCWSEYQWPTWRWDHYESKYTNSNNIFEWFRISAGTLHSLILQADGSLWAFGGNNNNKLGDGTTTTEAPTQIISTGVAQVAAGSVRSMILKVDESLGFR